MSSVEESAKAYEMDYAYAPIGLFVLPVWLGSITLGLFGFILNYCTSKGIHTFINDDVHGVQDGAAAFVVIFVLSLALGFIGRAFTLKKRDLDGLWKIAKFGIPLIGLIVAILSIAANH